MTADGSLTVAQESCRHTAVQEIRLDAGRIGSIKRTPQGGLRVDARLTRTGVLEYRQADGTVRRELRPPDEVFRADSLDSLRGAPVTDLHPSTMVRTDNYRDLAAGHVADDVREDSGRYVSATLVVQDARLVELIERGDRREVSLGYTCDYDPTPGDWNGEKYDGVQRSIVYNHAAIGPRDWGRAGSEVALRIDSADAVVGVCLTDIDHADEASVGGLMTESTEGQPAPEKKLDGRCDTCGAPVGEDGKFQTMTEDSKRSDELHGRLDAANAEIATLKAKVSELEKPERIADAVKEVVEARAIAERAGVRSDSCDVHAIRSSVVEKVLGIRCDGKSPEYLAGAYEAAVSALEARGIQRERDAQTERRSDSTVSVLEDFRISQEIQQMTKKGGR